MRKWIFLKYWSFVFRFQTFRYNARLWLAKQLHRLADRIDPERGLKDPVLVDSRHAWTVEGRSIWR